MLHISSYQTDVKLKYTVFPSHQTLSVMYSLSYQRPKVDSRVNPAWEFSFKKMKIINTSSNM